MTHFQFAFWMHCVHSFLDAIQITGSCLLADCSLIAIFIWAFVFFKIDCRLSHIRNITSLWTFLYCLINTSQFTVKRYYVASLTLFKGEELILHIIYNRIKTHLIIWWLINYFHAQSAVSIKGRKNEIEIRKRYIYNELNVGKNMLNYAHSKWLGWILKDEYWIEAILWSEPNRFCLDIFFRTKWSSCIFLNFIDTPRNSKTRLDKSLFQFTLPKLLYRKNTSTTLQHKYRRSRI